MRRTKEWWKQYRHDDRWFIWTYERAQNKYCHNDGYLPDDCSECPCCGEPQLGSGICTWCTNRYDKLISQNKFSDSSRQKFQTEGL